MQRKRHSPEFKVKAALEALRGNKTINDITSEGIHGIQTTQWKKQAQEGLKGVFTHRRGKAKSQEPLIEELYQNFGRRPLELE